MGGWLRGQSQRIGSTDQYQRDARDRESHFRNEAFSGGSSVTSDLRHDPPIQSCRRMSALVSIPDPSRTSCEGREVPQPDSCAATGGDYSITSSALASKVGGTIIPMSRAALVLIESLKEVG
jgi:hypothetical protein